MSSIPTSTAPQTSYYAQAVDVNRGVEAQAQTQPGANAGIAAAAATDAAASGANAAKQTAHELFKAGTNKARQAGSRATQMATATSNDAFQATQTSTKNLRDTTADGLDRTQGFFAQGQAARVGTRPITVTGYHSFTLAKLGAAVGLGLGLVSLFFTTTVLVPLSWIYFAGGTACALNWLVSSFLRAQAKAEDPNAEPYTALENNARAWESTTDLPSSSAIETTTTTGQVAPRVRQARMDTSGDLGAQVEDAVALCNSVVASLEERRRNLKALAEESNRKIVEHDEVIERATGASATTHDEIRTIAASHNETVQRVNNAIADILPTLKKNKTLMQLNKDRIGEIAAQEHLDADTLASVIASRKAEAAKLKRVAAGMRATQKAVDNVLESLDRIKQASSVIVREEERERVIKIKEKSMIVDTAQAGEVEAIKRVA